MINRLIQLLCRAKGDAYAEKSAKVTFSQLFCNSMSGLGIGF
ncbi:hypothetical protein PEPNEM18_01007 [Aedoeadaptatus nemausensis]|uniref:Uncharacterized protein n=1 Tax=Aedoeadaptatus nemausensis TaxID=2582829 RepID=A0A6V6Y3S3_9FIRM|nr:hypothetical protein [Peptoniphilus nemausensis]CAC9931560.1 hypothetical protein PEPNEM18_01007 [Peptoniphilus nemausensis]